MAELVDYNNNDIGFHYSTEEQWTGKYWIDGKKIYTKTITGITNPTAASSVRKVYTLDSNMSYAWIDYSNSFYVENDVERVICHLQGNNAGTGASVNAVNAHLGRMYIRDSNTKELIWEMPYKKIIESYIVIYYTKTTD